MKQNGTVDSVRMGDAYDVMVIGAGTGGYSAALRAAQLGKRVALVERDERLGGTCLLRGCIPAKALLQSAAVMDTVDRAAEWGIKASGEPDWSAVKAFEDRIVTKLVNGVTGLVKLRGIDVLKGTARLLPGPEVEVNGTRYAATDVVIATGSQPRMLPGVEVTDRVITSDQALFYDRIPSSAVVIGAGAVGLEFASLYRSFGAGGHAGGGPPARGPAGGRRGLEGNREGLPQAWRHERGRRHGGLHPRHGRARRGDV